MFCIYTIYKLTSPTGKIYIGQTKESNLERRWGYGNNYRKNIPLYNDIMEYGWKNFEHEALEIVETKSEATEKERYYILLYKSYEPEHGYNKSVNESSQPVMRTYIRCIETGVLYESMVAAGEKYGVTNEAIRQSIIKGWASGGKHWEKVQMTRDEYLTNKYHLI